MTNFDDPPRAIEILRAEWAALPEAMKDDYHADYAEMVIASGKDAANHPYHAILKQP